MLFVLSKLVNRNKPKTKEQDAKAKSHFSLVNTSSWFDLGAGIGNDFDKEKREQPPEAEEKQIQNAFSAELEAILPALSTELEAILPALSSQMEMELTASEKVKILPALSSEKEMFLPATEPENTQPVSSPEQEKVVQPVSSTTEQENVVQPEQEQGLPGFSSVIDKFQAMFSPTMMEKALPTLLACEQEKILSEEKITPEDKVQPEAEKKEGGVIPEKSIVLSDDNVPSEAEKKEGGVIPEKSMVSTMLHARIILDRFLRSTVSSSNHLLLVRENFLLWVWNVRNQERRSRG